MMTNAELVLVLGFFSRLQASQDYNGTKDFEPVMWEGEFILVGILAFIPNRCRTN